MQELEQAEIEKSYELGRQEAEPELSNDSPERTETHECDYKTNHGFMWLCPECGLIVHSDFTECVRCGKVRPSAERSHCADVSEDAPDTNVGDMISKSAVLDILYLDPGIDEIREKMIKNLPSAEPERKTCEGCKHKEQWENEYENGYSCPCVRCSNKPFGNPALTEIKEVVERLPAADVVEVIRCRDCRHYNALVAHCMARGGKAFLIRNENDFAAEVREKNDSQKTRLDPVQ